MKRKLSHNKPEGHDVRQCSFDFVSSQNETTCPSAAAGSPADGRVVNNVSTENYPSQINHKSMAESVTRHTLISSIDKIELLTCGVDSLDVGFYVLWGDNWGELRKEFDERKSCAKGTEGCRIDIAGVRPHIFYAGGKAPNYRYHVRFPEYHCFISITQSASRSPNIYVSFTSEAIHWEYSEVELIERVTQDIESLGGTVINHKISRCDLYADFRIPGGLSLDFLNSSRVGKAQHTSHFMKGDSLETFYVGEKSSPLELRIYNKSVEIKKKGTEERWMLVWFTDNVEDVWRIEFQIRRQVLKQYGINTIDDLRNQKADMWKYASGEWFSLRYRDDENQTRCRVHEFWEKVQSCAQSLGLEKGTRRNYEKKGAIFINWYLQRFINLLISCGALLTDDDPESCMMKIYKRSLPLLNKEEFREKVRKKSVEYGVSITNEVSRGNCND
jgi:hypothetical protein